MANRIVQRTFRGRVTPRRSTQWIGSTDETTVTALGASSVVLDQSFPFGEPATIVRIRGGLWVQSDQLATTERAFGAIGMAVVTDQALAIGVTAVPTPITDSPSEEFLLWAPFYTDVQRGDGTGFIFNSAAYVPLESKAMRKVDDSRAIVVVLQNISGVGMNYLMHFRMLVKLHG